MTQPKPVVLHANDNTGLTACFDFEDMQVLREEYEEKLRRVAAERDAAVAERDDVRERAVAEANRAAELRIARLQQEHLHNNAILEARRKEALADQRQLIEELTIELAAVREALATMVQHAAPAPVVSLQTARAQQQQQQQQQQTAQSAQTAMRKRRIRLR